MLVKSCIYFIVILINLCSIPLLIYSVKGKNKNIYKNIVIIDTIYILYLIVINLFVFQGDLFSLYIEYGLEIVFLHLMSFIAGIIYIISIIICKKKIRKNENGHPNPKSNKIILLMFALILLPILFFFCILLREKYLINNSTLVLIYDSRGNGGFGDSETFAYAISNDYCEQISLGTAIDGYYLEKILPKNAIEISNIENFENYEITFNESWEDNSILIYKNNKYICKKKNKSHYFNIEFERGFYLNHN